MTGFSTDTSVGTSRFTCDAERWSDPGMFQCCWSHAADREVRRDSTSRRGWILRPVAWSWPGHRLDSGPSMTRSSRRRCWPTVPVVLHRTGHGSDSRMSPGHCGRWMRSSGPPRMDGSGHRSPDSTGNRECYTPTSIELLAAEEQAWWKFDDG